MPMPLQPKPIEDAVGTQVSEPFCAAIKAHKEANSVDLESLVDTEWLEAVRGARVFAESVVSKEGIDTTTKVDIHTPYGQMVECLRSRMQWSPFVPPSMNGCWLGGRKVNRDELNVGTIESETSFQRLAETVSVTSELVKMDIGRFL